MQEGGDPWHVTPALRLSGVLDIEVLSRSLDTLVQRHDSLRARIVLIGGEMRQVIDEPSQFRLRAVRCQGVSMRDRENDARLRIREFHLTPIHIAVGLLFDAVLMELAEQEYVLAITVHHSITDGISIAQTVADLWSLYGDLIRDQAGCSGGRDCDSVFIR